MDHIFIERLWRSNTKKFILHRWHSLHTNARLEVADRHHRRSTRSASGLNAEQIAHILDQTDRLATATRLLDVGISGQNMAERLTEAFFAENYDFLGVPDHEALPGFYVPLGEWTKSDEDEHPVIVQDGSGWAGKLDVATTRFISRLARKN